MAHDVHHDSRHGGPRSRREPLPPQRTERRGLGNDDGDGRDYDGPLGWAMNLDGATKPWELERYVETECGAKIGRIRPAREQGDPPSLVTYYGVFFRCKAKEDMEKLMRYPKMKIHGRVVVFGDPSERVPAKAVFKENPKSSAPTDQDMKDIILKDVRYSDYRPFEWRASKLRFGQRYVDPRDREQHATARMLFDNFYDFVEAARACTKWIYLKLYVDHEAIPLKSKGHEGPGPGAEGRVSTDRGDDWESSRGGAPPRRDSERRYDANASRSRRDHRLRERDWDDMKGSRYDAYREGRHEGDDMRISRDPLMDKERYDVNMSNEKRGEDFRASGRDGDRGRELRKDDLRHALVRKQPDDSGAGVKRAFDERPPHERDPAIGQGRDTQRSVITARDTREGRHEPSEGLEKAIKRPRYSKEDLAERSQRPHDRGRRMHLSEDERRPDPGRRHSMPAADTTKRVSRSRDSPPRAGRSPTKRDEPWIVEVRNVPRNAPRPFFEDFLRGHNVHDFKTRVKAQGLVEVTGWGESSLENIERLHGMLLKSCRLYVARLSTTDVRRDTKSEDRPLISSKIPSSRLGGSPQHRRASEGAAHNPGRSRPEDRRPHERRDGHMSLQKKRSEERHPYRREDVSFEESRGNREVEWRVIIHGVPEKVDERNFARMIGEFARRNLMPEVCIRFLDQGVAEITGQSRDAFSALTRLDGKPVGRRRLRCEVLAAPESHSPSPIGESDQKPFRREMRPLSEPSHFRGRRDPSRDEQWHGHRQGSFHDNRRTRVMKAVPSRSPLTPVSTPRSPVKGQKVEIACFPHPSPISPSPPVITKPTSPCPGPELMKLADRLNRLQNKIVNQRKDDEESFDDFCATLSDLRTPQKLVYTFQKDPPLVGHLTWTGNVTMGHAEAKRVRLILIPKPAIPDPDASLENGSPPLQESQVKKREEEAKLMDRLPFRMHLNFRCKFEDVAGTVDPDSCQVYWLKCEGSKHDRAYLKGMVRALREKGRVGMMKWDVGQYKGKKRIDIIACPLTGWMARRLKIPWSWKDVIGEGLVVFIRYKNLASTRDRSPQILRSEGRGVRFDAVR